jgi:hypothetical protein
VGRHCTKTPRTFFLIKPTDTLISQIYFVKKLYMFLAVPLSIIRSFPLYIRHWYMSCRLYDIVHVNVQWKTPDDGQRNCPKHVVSWQNKFGKLLRLLVFIQKKFVKMYGHMNVKHLPIFYPYWNKCQFKRRQKRVALLVSGAVRICIVPDQVTCYKLKRCYNKSPHFISVEGQGVFLHSEIAIFWCVPGASNHNGCP